MNNIIERIETVAAIRNRQAVWADWMEKATSGVDESTMVKSFTKITPFGDYLMGLEIQR